eukprot:1395096-Amorphochlora_amoeboformis.AAC.1
MGQNLTKPPYRFTHSPSFPLTSWTILGDPLKVIYEGSFVVFCVHRSRFLQSEEFDRTPSLPVPGITRYSRVLAAALKDTIKPSKGKIFLPPLKVKEYTSVPRLSLSTPPKSIHQRSTGSFRGTTEHFPTCTKIGRCLSCPCMGITPRTGIITLHTEIITGLSTIRCTMATTTTPIQTTLPSLMRQWATCSRRRHGRELYSYRARVSLLYLRLEYGSGHGVVFFALG